VRGRRIDPLVFAGIALLALTIGLTALGARPDEADHGLTASVYDEGGGGAATLRRLIDAMGIRTTTLEGDRFAPQIADESVLFMLRPSELVTVQDVAAVRAYVDAGGTVVIAHDFEPLIEPLLAGFDIGFGTTAATQTFRLSGALFGAPPAREIQSLAGRELRLGTAWDPVGTDGQAPTVAMRTEGRGTIVVVGTSTPFLTESIANADNAHFAVALAAAAFTANGAVAFDEYHHGVHPSPDILAVVERTWPGRALLFAGIVIFAYVALTGRRLGPPMPLDPRPPRSSLEYVRGFAGLVRRSGRQEIVRDRLLRELHQGLARRAGLDPATPFDRVVAQIGTVSATRAEEAAALDARLRRRLREAELVRTVAKVAALLREEAP
jgi:hypothetical protein